MFIYTVGVSVFSFFVLRNFCSAIPRRHKSPGMSLSVGSYALCCRIIVHCRKRSLLRELIAPSTSRRENATPWCFPLAHLPPCLAKFLLREGDLGFALAMPLSRRGGVVLCCRIVALCRNHRLLRALLAPGTSLQEKGLPPFSFFSPSRNLRRKGGTQTAFRFTCFSKEKPSVR